MRGLAVVIATLAALAAAAPAAAGQVEADARAAKRGLARAVAAGRLTPESAARYRDAVDRAVVVWRKLSGARAANLAGALHEAAVLAPRYDEPRALAIFAGLEVNTDYFGNHAAPSRTIDVEGDDGVVYRLFAPRGLQFHPLANFAKLNAHAVRKDYEARARLADALLMRAVPTRTGLTWEYYFPFGGGAAPWTSGMAQAVGAQALARAGTRLGSGSLLGAAAAAYRSVPERLLMQLSVGPWIRHYSFSGLVVLNSHLQSAFSLAVYAELAHDLGAERLSSRLRTSAVRLLPRFDTGFWSRYSLGRDSPLKYHNYVISLLRLLGTRTGEPSWRARATRFERYVREPPRVGLGPPIPAIFPLPADGFRDYARIRFWLSKPSTVRLRVGGRVSSLYLETGWHTLHWYPGRRPAGVYRPYLRATDLAGNTAAFALRPVLVRRHKFSQAAVVENPVRTVPGVVVTGG